MNGNENTENQTVTQEEFDQLKAELEAEKAKAEAAVVLHEKDKQELQERITTLQTEASAKGDEITALKAETDGHTQALAALTQERDTARTEAENWQAAHDYAVADYRALVLSSNPVFSDELITGASIEEVKASVGKATALVGKVKESLDVQAQALAQLTTIPAGSPQGHRCRLGTLRPSTHALTASGGASAGFASTATASTPTHPKFTPAQPLPPHYYTNHLINNNPFPSWGTQNPCVTSQHAFA